MTMLLLFCLLWSCLHHEKGSAQKWVTPTNRVIYSLDGKAENLSWHMDYEGKLLFNARWTAYNDVDGSEKVLISVLRGTRKSVFHPNITTLKYMSFNSTNFIGKIGVHKLKAASFHRIGCEVTFRDVDAEYQDFVTIRYAGYAPLFSQSLPKRQTYMEGDEAITTVEVKGNPKPIIIWKLKDEEITPGSRVRIINQERLDRNNDTIITSVLHIKTLLNEDTGIVEVIVKYGNKIIKSPHVSARMMLDVQFEPRDISFTSNVTSARILQNDNYVALTCAAKGNPPPIYKVSKAIEVLHVGRSNLTVYHISGIHEGRHAWFTCTASNSLGKISREMTLPLHLDDEEVVARSNLSRADSSWLKYFIIGAVVLLIIFVTISLISFVVRRKMRSMTITDESTVAKMSQRPGKLSYGVTSSHLDYPNLAYDLSNKAPPSRSNRGSSRLSSFTNDGLEISQELSNVPSSSVQL